MRKKPKSADVQEKRATSVNRKVKGPGKKKRKGEYSRIGNETSSFNAYL